MPCLLAKRRLHVHHSRGRVSEAPVPNHRKSTFCTAKISWLHAADRCKRCPAWLPPRRSCTASWKLLQGRPHHHTRSDFPRRMRTSKQYSQMINPGRALLLSHTK